MLSHTLEPFERPQTLHERGRSLIDPSALDEVTKLSTVPSPVGPNQSNVDPNPDLGIYSHP